MSFKRINSLLAVFTLCAFMAGAQDRPIGYWRAHLPYNSANGLATDGTTVYTLCNQAFFTLDATSSNNTMVPYSKVEGMSDIGMQCVGYDKATATTILVYQDGNIDLFKEKESTFYNIPDLKIKSISGAKTVNMVYAENGIAYLSTSIGVLVIDLTTHNINETYQFDINNQVIPVNGFIGNGNYFYAITPSGLYRANKNNPQLQNFQVWQLVDTNSSCSYIASVHNKLFLASEKALYALVGDTLKLLYACSQGVHDSVVYAHDKDGKGLTIRGVISYKTNDLTIIQHIDAGDSQLLVSEFRPNQYNGDILFVDTGLQFVDTFGNIGSPLQATQLADGSIWVADSYYGLEKRTAKNNAQRYAPPGPAGPYAYDIYANNKELWIAHGGFNDDFYATPYWEGVSNFKNDKWTYYRQGNYHPFDTVDAFVALLKDETNGTMYMGSYLQGLFILNTDGSYQLVNTAVFDSSNSVFHDNQRQIVGLGLDNQDNLWVTASGAYHQLYAKTPDGNWYKFRIPLNIGGGPIAIDDYGQIWFVSYSGGGLTVYNTNGTLSDPSDDSYYHLGTGVGNGNLPSNKVLCLAKDKNNSIWLGTDNGIGIVSNCSVVPNSAPCDGQIPIVQYDQFAGYLFAGNSVRAIAVDGANRKWVGTDAGVWLLSPNANKIIYRFTVDNSPLPSNAIKKISIDKVTGDVYIGTEQGVVSFRSTATDGDASNHRVEIFPNPVPTGYGGTIAIKGLVANADVRITDIDGQLVYKTTALGGQAVWNGMDYTGHRPASGVYLVFASSSDGSQTYTGKIVFVQ